MQDTGFVAYLSTAAEKEGEMETKGQVYHGKGCMQLVTTRLMIKISIREPRYSFEALAQYRSNDVCRRYHTEGVG